MTDRDSPMKCVLLMAVAVAGQLAGAADSYEKYIGSGPGKVPGGVLVNCIGGKVTTQCFGYADVAAKKPMTADTVGWLASNTKAIACALVLSYVEEGKLSLDAPISRYLPEWMGDKVPTLRQLMSHTSGLKFFPEMPIDNRPMMLLSRLGVKRGMTASPGEKFQYSNWGIDVAAACVEAVAGEPWEVLLKERILDPLDMRDAVFHPTAKSKWNCRAAHDLHAWPRGIFSATTRLRRKRPFRSSNIRILFTAAIQRLAAGYLGAPWISSSFLRWSLTAESV